jgi:DNA polymerase
MDALAVLHLHLDWGADEALEVEARDRLQAAAAQARGMSRHRDAAGYLAEAPASPSQVSFADQAAARAGQQNDLVGLEAAEASFEPCPLQATARHILFGAGPSGVLMVLGDTPGAEEDQSGTLFAGSDGALLDRMLASIGLERSGLRLAYAVPWRPPGNRPATEAERALCRPFLLRHIALARPTRLLLLGAPVAAMLLPGMTVAALRKRRGEWLSVTIPGLTAPVAALISFSPDHLRRKPGDKPLAWADLLLLRRAMDADRP